MKHMLKNITGEKKEMIDNIIKKNNNPHIINEYVKFNKFNDEMVVTIDGCFNSTDLRCIADIMDVLNKENTKEISNEKTTFNSIRNLNSINLL